MEPLKFLKSLYITFTLVLIFLSSIPKTGTLKPDKRQVSSGTKTDPNTELELFKSAPKRNFEDNYPQKRMALSLVTRDVADITQEEISNNFVANNTEYYTPINTGFSITELSEENVITLKDVQNLKTLIPETTKDSNIGNISSSALELDLSDRMITLSEEFTELQQLDEIENDQKDEWNENINGSQDKIAAQDFGRGLKIAKINNGSGNVSDSYIQAGNKKIDPCKTNHDDTFVRSAASKLYTKGPKLAYAYIAGLWLTVFLARIVNAIKKN
ncbi:uncharacterized protein LOC111055591 [Nilaparvata lugens]|uniref:uncharacterized protein LOC111055591 n=1 Tax=Nilaparvata lugens TaxID=108931 RepID=UPI00193DC435|nr:uncharacterized protein LOC111055591 [Nilaparvata lugens]